MKRKILFVDDDRNVLDGFRTMLHPKRRDWKGRFALSAEEGLKLVDAEEFDVVIADMRMPGMDGADFLGEVEKRQPGTVRMILSGYSEMKALLKSAKHAHQFLSKPCSSEVIIATIQRALELQSVLNDDSVREIVAQLDSLPAIPDLYVKVAEELQSGEPDLQAVADLVEQDIGISATLMKVVNSSFFGFYETVTTPSRAVVLLGVEALKGLILGVNLLRELDLSDFPGYSVEKLWEHSLQTGYFAKVIANEEGLDREVSENCFICGILHDVGKLVLVTNLPEKYRSVLETVQAGNGPILDAEERVLGVNHAGIGAYLLGLWGFGIDVVSGVLGHHSPVLCGEGVTPGLVVHAANVFQHELADSHSGYHFTSLDSDWFRSQQMEERLGRWREVCAASVAAD